MSERPSPRISPPSPDPSRSSGRGEVRSAAAGGWLAARWRASVDARGRPVQGRSALGRCGGETTGDGRAGPAADPEAQRVLRGACHRAGPVTPRAGRRGRSAAAAPPWLQKVCSAAGNSPPRTSSAKRRVASVRTPARSAYRLTKRGALPVRRPAMSCQTSTWASVSGPAPMPTVGIGSSCGDPLGDLAGHHLQHHRERAGLGDRARVGDHLLGRVAAALHPVAAERVLALRGEADVRHHRDAGAGDRRDLRRARAGRPPASPRGSRPPS